MAKQKLWFKKRTTRGRGRAVNGGTRLTAKNINREVYKNQRIYSHFLLKLTLFLVLGMTWLRLGVKIGFVEILPVGLAVGLIFAMFERFRIGRRAELIILILATIASYVSPIGIII